jgi:hypothetical protein
MQLAIYLDVRQRTCVNLKVDGVLQRTGSFDHFGLNIDSALGNTIHTKQWNVCQGICFPALPLVMDRKTSLRELAVHRLVQLKLC